MPETSGRRRARAAIGPPSQGPVRTGRQDGCRPVASRSPATHGVGVGSVGAGSVAVGVGVGVALGVGDDGEDDGAGVGAGAPGPAS
ncbi:hypothetical protein DZF99_04850 [Clavibacter phaseoli]|nr:hypothetical protein DZF99_04850 [Clavibacter phaseoli]